MSELVAFVFRDQFRAPEVLNELRRRDWSWVRDLDEAVAVMVDERGEARVHLTIDLSNYRATGWARVWGAFVRTTLFVPLADVMVKAAVGFSLGPKGRAAPTQLLTELTPESEWWREVLNHSNNFRRDVAALLTFGGSAIFMLLRSTDATAALNHLGNYGNTIVHTTVSADQDEKLCSLLTFCRESRP